MVLKHQNGDSPNDPDSGDSKRRPIPQFLPSNHQMSVAALREKIGEEFIAETSSRPDILLGAADEASRRALIRDVVDYVLAVESITLSRADKMTMLDVIYSDLFRLGPLDVYLTDETVTELTIDGPERVYVRHGANEMATVDACFDDLAHLERVMQCTLSTAGTQLSESDPFVEVGTLLTGRPARLTVAAPPVSAILHIEIRLRPTQPAILPSLISMGMVDEPAAKLLQAILTAGHGLMIVGDVGTGKTTLLEALLPSLPEGSMIVERAAELRFPPGMEHRAAIPPALKQPLVSFADQISAALDKPHPWLVLDEVRFDEADAMWRALATTSGPRCLWAFRGATNPLRLRTAFSMSVRRAQQGINQVLINAGLLDRLPFVALLARQNQQIKLIGISEWQQDKPSSDTLTLRSIWPDSGAKPIHTVDWTYE